MQDAIEKALKTWYPVNHPLHLDPKHPAIKLAGEAGEILDLYGKHEYKPGFSWLICAKCKCTMEQHNESPCACNNYVSLIIDELGDLWYYLRILAYQQNLKFEKWELDVNGNALLHLVCINYRCAVLLLYYNEQAEIRNDILQAIYGWLLSLLQLLNITLDQLTESNYRKLNSDPTHHGWKNAG